VGAIEGALCTDGKTRAVNEEEDDFELMAHVIAEEISARLAINDEPQGYYDPEWANKIGRLAADVVLRPFRVERISPASG
jgi:hypothetical protein